MSPRCFGTAASAEPPPPVLGDIPSLHLARRQPCSLPVRAARQHGGPPARRPSRSQPCVVAGMQRQSLFSHGRSGAGSTDPSLCRGGRGRAWLHPAVNKWELSAVACQAGAIQSVRRARRRVVSVARRGVRLAGPTFTTTACPSASLPRGSGLFGLVSAVKSRSVVTRCGRSAGAADTRGCKAFGSCSCRI